MFLLSLSALRYLRLLATVELQHGTIRLSDFQSVCSEHYGLEPMQESFTLFAVAMAKMGLLRVCFGARFCYFDLYRVFLVCLEHIFIILVCFYSCMYFSVVFSAVFLDLGCISLNLCVFRVFCSQLPQGIVKVALEAQACLRKKYPVSPM